MKLKALAAFSALALFLCAPAPSESANATSASTTVIVGTIKAIKDKSGDKTVAVAIKTSAGAILVPTKSIENFAPYDGRTMKISCAVQDKTLIPLCVLRDKAPPADRRF